MCVFDKPCDQLRHTQSKNPQWICKYQHCDETSWTV